MSTPCPFCEIIAGNAPATIIREWLGAIAIVPLHPVTEGHTLVIPYQHESDFTAVPDLTGHASELAAELAEAPCNLIISAGAPATQSVWHLHVHIVPRRADDDLLLPWGSNVAHVRRHRRMWLEALEGTATGQASDSP